MSRLPTGMLGGRSAADIQRVQRVVKARYGLLRACYQRQLHGAPDLAGDVVVKLSIARDGAVSNAEIDPAYTTLASEVLLKMGQATAASGRYGSAASISSDCAPTAISSGRKRRIAKRPARASGSTRRYTAPLPRNKRSYAPKMRWRS